MPEIKKAKDVKPGDWHYGAPEPFTKVVFPGRNGNVEFHISYGSPSYSHPEFLMEVETEEERK